jgi:hypothetical protein
MIDINNFTKSQILNITNPAKLFNLKTYKQEFHKLSMQYHPDRGGDALVFDHILKLYHQAELNEGYWGYLGSLIIVGLDSSEYHYNYYSKSEFELGFIYVTDTEVIYAIDNTNTIDFKLPEYKYRDDAMIKAFENLVVLKFEKVIIGKINKYYIIKKPEDCYLLKDIIIKNKIPITQTAWILSRLYNLGCFFNYNNLVHCDLSLNTITINPEKHSIGIIGGWNYVYKENDTIKMLPKHTYDILPRSIIENKKAITSIMTEQIHALGRELLGSRFGSYLELSKLDFKFAEWLTNAGFDNIIKEYKKWDSEILQNIFGVRKFVKWDLKKEDIY